MLKETSLIPLRVGANRNGLCQQANRRIAPPFFMGNVSEDADSQEIEALAEECGASISRINWLFDRDTNHFKGCGFIHFRNTESVDLFLVNHGRYVQGRRLRLNFPKNNVPRV